MEKYIHAKCKYKDYEAIQGISEAGTTMARAYGDLSMDDDG